jgi:hypothetical protein
MMEAARTTETSVDIQLRTRQYIPEDSELYTRCRENLKSHCSAYDWRAGRSMPREFVEIREHGVKTVEIV